MCIVKLILWRSVPSSLHCHTASKELPTVVLRLWPRSAASVPPGEILHVWAPPRLARGGGGGGSGAH